MYLLCTHYVPLNIPEEATMAIQCSDEGHVRRSPYREIP